MWQGWIVVYGLDGYLFMIIVVSGKLMVRGYLYRRGDISQRFDFGFEVLGYWFGFV